MQNRGFHFPKIGLGCLNLTRENNAIIDVAIQNNCTMFDTADCYGNGESETALGIKLKHYQREKFIICTKVGVKFTNAGVKVQGDEKYILHAVEASLERLQSNYIDILQLHRIDPEVPIETSMRALKKLFEQKKIRAIGLSEVTAAQIKRAHKIHPITSVQIEYSPCSLQDEKNKVIETCKKLNIKIIAYSPLNRGMFSSLTMDFFEQLPKKDFRTQLPRFQDENLKINFENRKFLENVAREKNCTLAQLVLAWIINKDYLPIPATINEEHFAENFQAQTIQFTENESKMIDLLLSQKSYKGERYANEKQSAIYKEKPFKTLKKIESFYNKNILGLFIYHHQTKKQASADYFATPHKMRSFSREK